MSDNTAPAQGDPIDAVILWVDGSDMRLAEKRSVTLHRKKRAVRTPEPFPHVSHHQTK